MIKGRCVKPRILGRDVAVHFEIICTNVLGPVCKGAAILKINKRTMKTNNIRKLIRTNFVTNVYKNWDCPRSVADFFVSSCANKKLQSAHFLTHGREIGNITFF